MNLVISDTSVFTRLRIILVETSHSGNIGAVARAMKTMGFSDLYLVNPRFDDALTQPDAIAFASGAQDILCNAKVVSHIDEALAGCQFVASVSARLREFSPPILTPREFGEKAIDELSGAVALIFGSERYGLPNDIVLKSHALINVPANPDYSSLNLAQAVQVLTYECRMGALSRQPQAQKSEVGFQGELASVEQIDGMYEHLEQALVKVEFLNLHAPKKLMPRLKRLFSRAQLEVEEVNIIRGISKKILEFTKS
ncbi:RNA methyltransferase [Undibacterium fentianense]|uniref:tRNA (cytidine/uridine-2'-O-)-methyltransferase TrmJ n=1 Tax=Undibacterium fentianense TaxID=2828728 RepID=A0A941DW71_9BURK|nr:RNA methyltransferase [Undibacterium fentianense]MBR7798444.1 RNA methyltransferase [Undibacterium fentianense]